MTKRILVVEDQDSAREFLNELLPSGGFNPTFAGDLPEALRSLNSIPFDVVLTDMRLPSGEGIEILRHLRREQDSAAPPVVIVTAYGSIDSAVKAVKEGAYDYLTKPFDPDRLLLVLQRAIEHKNLREENLALKSEVGQGWGFDRLQTRSPRMQRVLDMAREVADKPSTTVLLFGESGSGKEVLARAIHATSSRRGHLFVPIHCAAIPENLLESELFGYEPGAFTGATRRKQGRAERAEGGTLFLDEVGDMPLPVQVKLLRVLETRTFERLGGAEPVHLDLRVMAATHRDLPAFVGEGKFREDLYYRLNVFPIQVPPLRERVEDIELLAEQYLRSNADLAHPIAGFTAEALAALKSYSWPGNIRELGNIIERAVILCKSERIGVEELNLPGFAPTGRSSNPIASSLNFWENEKALVLRAMREAGNNQSKAADLLSMTRGQLRKRLERYGLL